jgi:hypothetical protein
MSAAMTESLPFESMPLRSGGGPGPAGGARQPSP